jgi:SpoVK/Ycf46/Vps4 family AAA+-type ATPase
MIGIFAARTGSRRPTAHRLPAPRRDGNLRVVAREGRAAVRSGRRGAFSVLVVGSDPRERAAAAEAVAAESGKDLFRIDLGRIVGRYIGGTDENLRRIFSAAERAGAILFLDEADALFGKRSDVKDAHDRYANLVMARLRRKLGAHRVMVVWGMRSSDPGGNPGTLRFDAVLYLRGEKAGPDCGTSIA